MPVKKVMVRVIQIARGALREGCWPLGIFRQGNPPITIETHIRHLLGNVRYSIQTTKTVERVDKAGDETYHIVFPAGLVDPRPEDEL